MREEIRDFKIGVRQVWCKNHACSFFNLIVVIAHKSLDIFGGFFNKFSLTFVLNSAIM